MSDNRASIINRAGINVPEITETFENPQLVRPSLTYTDSLNLCQGYSYARLKPGL